MLSPQYNVQDYDAARDEAAVHALWQSALGASWPIDLTRMQLVLSAPQSHHFVVRSGERVLGFAATQSGTRGERQVGYLGALLVAPETQRHGIGSLLHEGALTHLRQSGADTLILGGLVPRFWCGLPVNLPAARTFFEQKGWQLDHSVYDLVGDLRHYATPERISQRLVSERISFETATEQSMPEVLAFEGREFPNWLMHYERGARLGDHDDILIARDERTGHIVGTLFMYSPRSHASRSDLIWQTLLGQDAGAIGAVGVAEAERGRGIGIGIVARASEILKERGVGNCYIDWVVLTDFYARLGYGIWREYQIPCPHHRTGLTAPRTQPEQ